MKRFIATFLAIVMSLSVLDITAFAAEAEGPTSETIVGGTIQTRASDAPEEYYT